MQKETELKKQLGDLSGSGCYKICVEFADGRDAVA